MRGIKSRWVFIYFMPVMLALDGLSYFFSSLGVVGLGVAKAISFFAGAIFSVLILISYFRYSKKAMLFYFLSSLFVVFYLLAYYRTIFLNTFAPVIMSADMIYLVLVYLIGLLLVRPDQGWVLTEDGFTKILDFTFGAMAIVVIANMVLFAMGFYEPRIAEYSLSLELIGVSLERVRFPLSPGINSYGYFLGLLAVYASHVIREYKGRRLVWGSIFAIAFVELMMVDSRGALIFVILSNVVVVVTAKLRRFQFIFAVFITQFSLLIFFFADLILSAIDGKVVSRGADLSSQRSFLWEKGLAILSRQNVDTLFGFGVMGQHATNENFPSAVDESGLISMHNSFSQIAIDVGLIPYVMYSGIVSVGLYKVFKKTDDAIFRRIAMIIVFVFMVSSVEINLTPTHAYFYLTYFLLLISLCFTFFENKNRTGAC